MFDLEGMEFTYECLKEMSKTGNFGELEVDQVMLALDIMDKYGDDIAEFGINGCFIVSTRSEQDYTELKAMRQ